MGHFETRCGATLSLCMLGLASAQIAPNTDPKLIYAIDGGVMLSVPLVGQPMANGMVKYVAAVSTPELVDHSIVYMVDDLNNPTASAAGQFKCTNNSGGVRGVEATVQFPLCPALKGGTKFGGTVTMLVVANADGGGVSCLPGANSIWQAHIGSSAVHSLFWCPFQMMTTASGSLQTNSVFGAPIPGLAGPESAPSLGSCNRFSITAGESFTITSNLVVKSLGTTSGCNSDINGDGAVDGLDLADLLSTWGDSNACGTGDLNNDGKIDGVDMAVLLGSWGNCGD